MRTRADPEVDFRVSHPVLQVIVGNVVEGEDDAVGQVTCWDWLALGCIFHKRLAALRPQAVGANDKVGDKGASRGCRDCGICTATDVEADNAFVKREVNSEGKGTLVEGLL